ncbi:MAG: NADH-quinone oxidoreductase subunit M [Elusimicrobiales bacterium]|nr:NADH-quinone oxidoreductase subunit M [Elusimicrobiales bacterium]
MSLLSLIVVTPLIGALLILAIPGTRTKLIQGVALVFSALCLLLTGYLYAAFDKTVVMMQFVEKFSWIPAFNINYCVGVDGLSVALVTLTGLLTMLAIIYSFNITVRVKEFFFWFLLLEVGMLGVFVALDFFLFYVFWELTLVPMYFLIGVWGGPKKEYAAIKFFLYTLFGSLLMLLGILALYFNSMPHTFDMLELIKQGSLLPRAMQIWIFLALYVGFAIKIPAFPFHTWLPLAHVEAPTGVSVILAGVLLKMGTYGIMRFSFPALPQATKWFMPFLIVIAIINIVYGAFCAMAQKDLKKMVAYSSVNHMGYCMLGMTAMSGIGWNGAVLQMITHGLITGSLFFLVGVIYDRAHTRDIDAFGGLAAKFPVYAGLMIIQVMASLGLPGLAGFVGEFLCFLGAFNVWPYYVAVGTIGILVTAAFFLRMIEKVFLGPFNEKWAALKDIGFREMVAIVPLVILTVVIGVWPKFCLDLIDPTITYLVAMIK